MRDVRGTEVQVGDTVCVYMPENRGFYTDIPVGIRGKVKSMFSQARAFEVQFTEGSFNGSHYFSADEVIYESSDEDDNNSIARDRGNNQIHLEDTVQVRETSIVDKAVGLQIGMFGKVIRIGPLEDVIKIKSMNSDRTYIIDSSQVLSMNPVNIIDPPFPALI